MPSWYIGMLQHPHSYYVQGQLDSGRCLSTEYFILNNNSKFRRRFLEIECVWGSLIVARINHKSSAVILRSWYNSTPISEFYTMILVTYFLFFVPIGPFSYVLSHIIISEVLFLRQFGLSRFDLAWVYCISIDIFVSLFNKSMTIVIFFYIPGISAHVHSRNH